MDYEEQLNRIEKIKTWMKEASKLKRKYEKEKNQHIDNINKYYENKKFDSLQQEVLLLQNLIEKKQIPLYNNIINYSENVLLAILAQLKKDVPEKSNILDGLQVVCTNIFLDEFKKMQQLLYKQLELFQTNNVKTVEGFFQVLENVNLMKQQELFLLKTISEDMKKIRTMSSPIKQEIDTIIGANAKYARSYFMDRSATTLAILNANMKFQTAMALSLLIGITFVTLFDMDSVYVATVPWIYKVGLKLLPATIKGNYLEIFRELVLS
jgi:hypothetical protein